MERRGSRLGRPRKGFVPVRARGCATRPTVFAVLEHCWNGTWWCDGLAAGRTGLPRLPLPRQDTRAPPQFFFLVAGLALCRRAGPSLLLSCFVDHWKSRLTGVLSCSLRSFSFLARRVCLCAGSLRHYQLPAPGFLVIFVKKRRYTGFPKQKEILKRQRSSGLKVSRRPDLEVGHVETRTTCRIRATPSTRSTAARFYPTMNTRTNSKCLLINSYKTHVD